MPVVAAASPAAAAFAIGFNAAGAGRKARFDRSMDAVGFNPRAYFEKVLWAAFSQRGVSLEPIADSRIERAVRSKIYDSLPKDLDAILDVQITSAGYYPSDRAGGYSPMLYVVARLLSTSRPGEELERFGYDADYRAAEGELRFYTTPPSISAANPEEIGAKSSLVRSTMEGVSDRIISQIVVDVERRMTAVPRLP